MRKTYYVNGIQVPTIEEYIQIRKMDNEFTLDDLIRIFAKPDNPDATQPNALTDLYNKLAAFTPQEFVGKYNNNSEILMTCFSIAGPEAALRGLKSKLIGSETITKKQKQTKLKAEFGGSDHNQKPLLKEGQKVTADMFEEKWVTYNDTYKLHKVDKNELKTRKDIYIIECDCTSTARKFFLFADSEHPQCQKPIDAIAWTMRKDDGTPLTREEYVTMEQES